MGTSSKKKSPKLLEKPEKNNSGADVGTRSASEKLRRMSGVGFRVLDRHRSTKPTTAS